jgi:TolB-like protein/Tfp pilus assembly protein PilF
MPSFLAEVRRRNLLRAAAANALIAWIIIEAGSVLLPTFGATETAFRVYTIVVIVGFAASLALAWVFGIAPEGAKLDREVDGATLGTSRPKQITNVVVIVLLVAALAISVTLNVAGVRDDEPGPSQAAARPSLAVLPFASLSTEPDNALFTDGIHDDLLTKLANIGSCKVISRTSVMEYRDTTKNLREIGEVLGVEAVVEGSVQRLGNNVRINIQLIDARTDEHLWAQSYDRQLTAQNVFQIQSEISAAIARALNAELTASERVRVAAVPTQDLRAYRLYVAGRDNLHVRRLEALQRGRKQFEQAIELDPGYAEAHAGLAESILLLMINHTVIPWDEAFQMAQASIDTALRLDPENTNAFAAQGLLQAHRWSRTRTGDSNSKAETAFRRALELNPNHAQAYMWFASLRADEQRIDEAIELYHRSMEVDPLGRIPYSNVPSLYARKGELQKAIDLWLEAIELHPDWPTPYNYLAAHLFGLGRLDEALAWHRKAEEVAGGIQTNNIAVGIYMALGQRERALEYIRSVPDDHPAAGARTAFVALVNQDVDTALAELDEVLEQGSAVQFLWSVVADVAVLAGHLDRVRELTRANLPALVEPKPQIDSFTLPALERLAYAYLEQGKAERGRELLEAALRVVRGLPRLGIHGQGAREAEILALLGRKQEALILFEAAVKEGYRSPLNSIWPIEFNPYLESLRGEPRYQEAVVEVEQSMRSMRRRVDAAHASGDWEPLRALASRSDG